MNDTGGPIHVLHVDDNPDFSELVATFLEREDERLDVSTATSVDEGLQAVAERDVDCVVSDHDMPGQNGIEFLDAVREDHPGLPFILFTGKGSEEVASEAISAGVTDYLQKATGTDQYTILANRITNTVESVRVRREQQRQIAAIETAQEGISILDENGHFVYVNQAYADLYGYDPTELIGEHWSLLYPDEEIAEIHEEVLPVLREQSHWHGTTTGLRSDGTTFVENHTLSTTEGGGIVCTVRDVTDREKRKRRLKETVTKLEALFENSPDMIATHDADGTILDVNERFANKVGIPKEEVVGKDVWEIDHTVDPKRARAFWAELSPDEIRKFEGRYERSDGSTFPVEIHLTRLNVNGEDQFLAISHDITERKERDRELEQTNALLSTLFDTLPVGVLVEDAERNVMTVNQKMFDLFDMPGTPSETVGADCAQLAAEVSGMFADAEAFVDRIDELVAERVPIDREELPLADGRTLERTYRPIELANGPGHLWVYRDVTDRKRRERRLERQNGRLEEFARVVSHDLRNPLNVAEGRLELARQECDSDHLDAVERAHERMVDLIEDLLTLAREDKTSIDVTPIDLADLTEQCWQNVETTKATLVADVDRVVRADESRLQQVFENLFRNAIEHGGKGVTVTVGDLEDGFYVEDDGRGIPVDERDRVFTPGYSTSNGGTGFGLSIVERIADSHGWDIRVTRESSGGARFEFTNVERVE